MASWADEIWIHFEWRGLHLPGKGVHLFLMLGDNRTGIDSFLSWPVPLPQGIFLGAAGEQIQINSIGESAEEHSPFPIEFQAFDFISGKLIDRSNLPQWLRSVRHGKRWKI